MAESSHTERQRRLRRRLVDLVYENHERQNPRFDHLHLYDMLERLHVETSENEVITLLQDLSTRGYVTFAQEKDRRTGRVSISTIELTAAGRDIAEEIETDRAIAPK